MMGKGHKKRGRNQKRDSSTSENQHGFSLSDAKSFILWITYLMLLEWNLFLHQPLEFVKIFQMVLVEIPILQ